MEETILKSAEQFAWEAKVQNSDKLGSFQKFLVAGMGGSHLAADLLKTGKPATDLLVHWGYDLPLLIEKDRLIIASSYSGNTEETLSAFAKAGELGLERAAISTGGKLLEEAKKAGVPYVELPEGVQPRNALGYAMRGLFKLMGEEEAYEELGKLATILKPGGYKEVGEELAREIKGRVPVVYSSDRNVSLAYNWKIKFNETGKIPSFSNVFPELNHNEMAGFDAKGETKQLAERFHIIFLRDEQDDPRIQKRMAVLEKLLTARGLQITNAPLEGNTKFERIFRSLLLADWTAYFTALQYGTKPEEVAIVEEFKKLI
ncbi:bifunctional phosphoglucose/phosphomannose isomerase [Patescibacteria group bacterium]|nr:bifunctional phosphoglucose/phosphomannose isomerase [Patescibacteria group bacterium]